MKFVLVNILLWFFITSFLSSCYYQNSWKKSRKLDKIDYVEIHDYSIDKELKKLNGIRVESSDKKIGSNINKYLSYDYLDSSLASIEFSYMNDYENENFDFTWYKYDRQLKEPLFLFNHSKWDSINNTYYEMNFSNDTFPKRDKNTISINYAIPNYESTRKFQISDQIVSYYKNQIKKYSDSLPLFDPPVIPKLSSCKQLLESRHENIEFLNEDSTEIKIFIIDSLLVNGLYKVDTVTRFRFYKKDTLADGLIHEKSRNTHSMYFTVFWERKYHKRERPLYLKQFQLDTNQIDTLFNMEMKTISKQDTILQHYIMDGIPIGIRLQKKAPYYVNTQPFPKKGELDYRMWSEHTIREMEDHRIPITHRDVKLYCNKKGEILKLHCQAKTDQGHTLEYMYFYNGVKAEVVIDKRVIKDVSGDQVYDLVTNGGYIHYNYLMPIKKEKLVFRPLRIFKKSNNGEIYSKGTKTIKRDRKNKILYREKKGSYNTTIYKIHFK